MAFNPLVSAYSNANALALAKLSQLAYGTAAVAAVRNVLGITVENVVTFADKDTDTQGFMVKADGAIVVVFRGTEDIRDWITDASIFMSPFKGEARVHSGFARSLDAVWGTITETLRGWSGGGRTIWLTGHSLGGALAVLASARLRFPRDPSGMMVPVTGVYTFGQPRVGNAAFAADCNTAYGNRIFRVVNDRDIVARLPPREVLGYEHCGKCLVFDADGALHEDVARWYALLDAVRVGVDALRAFQGGGKKAASITAIADHAITEYIAKLEKLAK